MLYIKRIIFCYLIITPFQSQPSFVQELKDERAIENETIVFECQFAGNPTPGNLEFEC